MGILRKPAATIVEPQSPSAADTSLPDVSRDIAPVIFRPPNPDAINPIISNQPKPLTDIAYPPSLKDMASGVTSQPQGGSTLHVDGAEATTQQPRLGLEFVYNPHPMPKIPSGKSVVRDGSRSKGNTDNAPAPITQPPTWDNKTLASKQVSQQPPIQLQPGGQSPVKSRVVEKERCGRQIKASKQTVQVPSAPRATVAVQSKRLDPTYHCPVCNMEFPPGSSDVSATHHVNGHFPSN